MACPHARVHSKSSLWRVSGRLQENTDVLHLWVFPVLSSASSTHHLTSVELRGLQIVQVRMSLRIAGWYPPEYGDWAQSRSEQRSGRETCGLPQKCLNGMTR